MFKIVFLVFAFQICPISIIANTKNEGNSFRNYFAHQDGKQFISSDAGNNENAKPKWQPAYEKPEEKAKLNGKPKIHFFESDGTCGVWDASTNSYVKPKMNYSTLEGIKCLHEFNKIAFGPACGHPAFSRVKLCSMVHFFDNELPNDSEVLAGDNIDMALVLIDGCAICRDGDENNLKMTLSIGMTYSEGSLFTKCEKDKQLEVSGVENLPFSLKNYSKRTNIEGDNPGTQFIVPGILYQRFCDGMFSSDEMPNSYEKIWMKVTHNCGGENRNFQIDLPPLSPREHQYHVAEMRGLLLDLANEEWSQFDMGKRAFGESKTLVWGNKLQDK